MKTLFHFHPNDKNIFKKISDFLKKYNIECFDSSSDYDKEKNCDAFVLIISKNSEYSTNNYFIPLIPHLNKEIIFILIDDINMPDKLILEPINHLLKNNKGYRIKTNNLKKDIIMLAILAFKIEDVKLIKKYMACEPNEEYITAKFMPNQSNKLKGKKIEFSTFGPSIVKNGDYILYQVYIHDVGMSNVALKDADNKDKGTELRGCKLMNVGIKSGEKILLHLEIKDFVVEEALQSITWMGKMTSVEFPVRVPELIRTGKHIGTITISKNSVPVGHLKFTIEVVHKKVETNQNTKLNTDSHFYRNAFICYCSQDRDEVLKRVQMLRVANIHYSQDILSIEPGDIWVNKLHSLIDSSDLFLLFWSTAASQSQEVRKEILYALEKQKMSDKPKIFPVIIEGPPPAKPPKELEHIHFNDSIVYFFNG